MNCLPSVVLAVIPMLLAAADTKAGEIEFNRDIRPILSDKCFFCHGQDAAKRQAKLRLDVEDVAKQSAIVAGSPGKSKLVERITSADPDERMPPTDSGKKLTPKEINLLKLWIAQGAKYQPHWAYVPVQRHAVPEVRNQSWPSNWIDRFILNRIERAGFAPAQDADPTTLLRRLHFDLTGLPPTAEEVAAFVHDASPAAYEKVVDRLLASDRYGERMAMYWLDLVRYADTVGYHGDQDHNISPYRDYVIDAFNDNMPFDQFTREQLAGDLIPGSGIDQKIASGYNRLLQTSHEGGVQAKEYLAIYAADRVRNLSAVWLAGTMGCAQCHDHKYDPFTAKDFYSMQAFFADIDEDRHLKKGSDSLPTIREPELKVLTKRERQRIAELKANNSAAAAKDVAALEKAARKTMITVATKPRPIRVLPRGNWLDETGPVVGPAVPAFFGSIPATDPNRRPTRLDLANWLTDPKKGIGGLTARVFVNRLWYLFFDAGVARSLDDFGGQGELPTHPELLDNLADDFHSNGWCVKRAVKQIVMSRTYRQASTVSMALRQADPDNRLFARQASYRLPAEMIRDNALAVSGLLVLDYGGPSSRPYQPDGYYKHLNFPKRTYKADTTPRQWRRGVYVHWQRQFLHPMLKALDAPSREECTAKRPRSNTPLAALALLNDPTFVEAARAFAERIIEQGGIDDSSKLRYAFRRAASREPDAFEADLLAKLLSQERQAFTEAPDSARKLTGIGLSPVSRKFAAAELAAWTSVARTLLNIDAVTTRN